MPDYIPVRPKEATQLQMLCAMDLIVANDTDLLKPRLKACGQWRNFRWIQTMLPKIIDALMGTMDPKKKAVFAAELSNSVIRITKPGTVVPKDMVLLPEDDVLWMLTDELSNHCAVCMGSGEDMRKCQFRKHLKGMTLFELDESGGVCMGRQIRTRNDI